VTGSARLFPRRRSFSFARSRLLSLLLCAGDLTCSLLSRPFVPPCQPVNHSWFRATSRSFLLFILLLVFFSFLASLLPWTQLPATRFVGSTAACRFSSEFILCRCHSFATQSTCRGLEQDKIKRSPAPSSTGSESGCDCNPSESGCPPCRHAFPSRTQPLVPPSMPRPYLPTVVWLLSSMNLTLCN
jgi:hypothetical protein